MNDPNLPYTPSEQEHFGRIGDSLIGAARAIMEREPRECPAPAQATIVPNSVADLTTDPVEKQIVRYLETHVECTRRQLRSVLGLSSATVARKTARLRAAGIILSMGRTKGAFYSLRGSEASN